MRDLIGNRLTEGNLLFWTRTGNLCKITKLIEGGLTTVKGDLTEPSVTIEITIVLDMAKAPRGTEPMVAEFLKVVDPMQQEILERAMGGGRTQ